MNRRRTKRAKTSPPPPSPNISESFVTSDLPVGKYGEIFPLSDNSGQTPVSGGSYYIFLDQTSSKVTLFHPFSMAKFQMDIPLFLGARGQNDWNPTPEKLVAFLSKKIKEWKGLNREVQTFIPLLVKHYEKLVEASI